MKYKTIVAILFLFTSTLFTQENKKQLFTALSQVDYWQITLTNGDTFNYILLDQLEGDSLSLIRISTTQRLSVNSILKVRKVNHSKYSQGWKIGCLEG